MRLSRHDAELMFDGPIPAGVIDDTLPSRLRAPVRIGAVTLKPAAVRARMVRALLRLLPTGCVTEADLERAGFTADEIRAHRATALAYALLIFPTLETMELPA